MDSLQSGQLRVGITKRALSRNVTPQPKNSNKLRLEQEMHEADKLEKELKTPKHLGGANYVSLYGV